MLDLATTLATLDPMQLLCLAVCAAVVHPGCNRRAARLLKAMKK